MSQVLIQGACIAGCALALLLAREGHGVTVIERASVPRSGGQAVDVRGAALKVVEQMGLADDIRARRTKFRGMSVYDEAGGRSKPRQSCTPTAWRKFEWTRGRGAELHWSAMPHFVHRL